MNVGEEYGWLAAIGVVIGLKLAKNGENKWRK
jgi:hypothetical protein